MSENSKKNKRKNQKDILTTLRDRIVEGVYPPGAKLVEQDLVQEYGVSRQMIREILVNLGIQRLVKKQPNKGVFVREIDVKSLLEIMEIREVLEGLAARLAARNSSPEDWADLDREFSESFDDIVKNTDFEKHLALSRKFRFRIFAAADSEELSILSETLLAKILIVQRRLTLLPGRIKHSAREQRAVLKAIIEGNPEKAEKMKRLNLRNAKDWLEKYRNWIF